MDAEGQEGSPRDTDVVAMIRFIVTQKMVDEFAALTGDYSSIHTSDEFARRSRFRRRVVHGMLGFSYLASALSRACAGERQDLAACQIRFLKPMFVGDVVRLEVEVTTGQGGTKGYEARWVDEATDELFIKSTGTLRAGIEAPVGGTEGAALVGRGIDENDLGVNDLSGRREDLEFVVSSGAARRLATILAGSDSAGGIYCGGALLAVVVLSTVVGMRLPGRPATFTQCQVTFTEPIEWERAFVWAASVKKVAAVSETMEAAVTLRRIDRENPPLAAGTYATMVNPAPRAVVSCRELQANHLELGLRGKVAIVTGSSRGIGAATAKLLAVCGAKVAVNYLRGKNDAEAVVADIRSAGGTATALRCDVTSEEDVSSFVRQVAEEFGGLHVLVNNAVKDTIPRDVLDLSWDDLQGELDVTLKGMHHCCRAAIPFFKQAGGGKIVNLSTIFVDNPVKGQGKYVTAKSAVVGYSRSLAREVVGDNIQVNVVAPNMTHTDLLGMIPGEMVRRMGQHRPAKRNLEPVEVAQAIAFLASQWSNSMSGQKLVLNLGEPPFT